MKKREKRQGQRPSNKLVGMAVVIIVVALVYIMNSMGNGQKDKNERDRAKIEQLKDAIAQEEARSEKLDAYEKYVNTKQFVEDIAREKLGLIYPDEKVFKNE